MKHTSMKPFSSALTIVWSLSIRGVFWCLANSHTLNTVSPSQVSCHFSPELQQPVTFLCPPIRAVSTTSSGMINYYHHFIPRLPTSSISSTDVTKVGMQSSGPKNISQHSMSVLVMPPSSTTPIQMQTASGWTHWTGQSVVSKSNF